MAWGLARTVIGVVGVGALALAGGCGSSPGATATGRDAGVEAGVDAAASRDAGPETGGDAAAGRDAGAPETGADTGPGCTGVPPSGFTLVVPSANATGNLGAHVSMALDANDDPMIAYVWELPVATAQNSQLFFTRWDACAAAWTTPQAVDTVGYVDEDPGLRAVSLAFDRGTGQVGIAYQKNIQFAGQANPTETEWIALLDTTIAGAAWRTAQVSQHDMQVAGDRQDTDGPGLAMANGAIYMAYEQNNRGCCPGLACNACTGAWFLSSPAGADPTTSAGFATSTLIPYSDATASLGGVAQATQAPVAVGVDSAGNPGVVLTLAAVTGTNDQEVFWRPGAANAFKVVDSNGVDNSGGPAPPIAALTFHGTTPRVLTTLFADANATYDLRFVAATAADGSGWAAPVQLPRDGDTTEGEYLTFAESPAGSLAGFATPTGGTGNNTCGAPKLLTSTEASLSSWSICGADATMSGKYTGTYVSAAYGVNDTHVQLAFQDTNGNGPEAPGVYYWRSP